VSAARRARVREAVAARELSALVVTHLPSVRYLTGYVGSNGIAVIAPEGTVLLTDARYAVAARGQVDDGVEVVVGARDLLGDTAAAVTRLTPRDATVGVEGAHMTMNQGARLTALLAETGDTARTLSPQTGIVEGVRAVKDAEEIAAVRRAAAVADDALADVLAQGVVGRTEREVAWAVLEALHRHGAEGASFETIVAAGPNAARPHAVPTGARIPGDTLLTIDMGAVVDGYCSDMTRTLVLGDPGPDLAEAYRVCHRAQRAALDAVRPGIACADLDRVARGVIEEAGLGEAFGHGLGHGVGLEIHEAPRLGREAPGTLAPGMIVTIEPGIYLEGRGGVRIEDLVAVTEDGAEILSSHPKDAPPRGGE